MPTLCEMHHRAPDVIHPDSIGARERIMLTRCAESMLCVSPSVIRNIRCGPSSLQGASADRQHHDKTCDDECACNESHNHNATSASGKFASYHIVLALEVAMEANKQYNNADADEGCSQGLANMTKMCCRVSIRVLSDASVEAEELSDGDADAGEG